MHVCYVDDSGKDHIRTFTGLLVPANGWRDLLGCWLEARARLTREFGVRKHVEIHAHVFTKPKKGAFCETEAQERVFRTAAVRAQASAILLDALAGCPCLWVTTVACRTRSTATAYEVFIDHLNEWAQRADTDVLVVLDAQEGSIDSSNLTQEQVLAERMSMYRNTKPYRDVHRSLPLKDRRVIEDPVLHNSAFSQLVQASDMVAYAAYQHIWSRPNTWPQGPSDGQPKEHLVAAYARFTDRWMQTEPDWDRESQDGVRWISRNPATET